MAFVSRWLTALCVSSTLVRPYSGSSCIAYTFNQEALIKLGLRCELQTARLKNSKGVLEMSAPLRLKNGPTVMLHLKACLLSPDVVLTTNCLDFGLVQTGKCKVWYHHHLCCCYSHQSFSV